MNASAALSKRMVLSYFRDRQSVLFSLMGVLVVVMLYLLFLRNMLISSYPDMPGMDHLVDAWVLSGILPIVPVTTCAGSLQTMVSDRADGRDRDMLVTPMSIWQIAAGYVLSTFVVGLAMSFITLALCIVYLAASGCPLSASGIAASAALIVPSTLSASVIMYTISSFIKSMGAFSGMFTVVSVLIGFLTGIYMPMGTMPDAMQSIGTLVPASHMAALFRDSLASASFDQALTGAASETVAEFRADMGFDLSLGGFGFDAGTMLLYVLGVTMLFFAISCLCSGRQHRR